MEKGYLKVSLKKNVQFSLNIADNYELLTDTVRNQGAKLKVLKIKSNKLYYPYSPKRSHCNQSFFLILFQKFIGY